MERDEKKVKLLINCQGIQDKIFPKSVSTGLFAFSAICICSV